MSQQSVQLDPLNSPHPIPWNWVLATLTSGAADAMPTVFSYRSPSLLSPDGRYAAYSRIQLQVQPEFFRSRVSSILFLENLETRDLQAITPDSPLADNPFLSSEVDAEGMISIVIPISWSETGDRLLARDFESLFCSDIASDYAVIVDLSFNRTNTVAPTRIQYTNAVLLGWSQAKPTCALFRAGILGEEDWQLWTVTCSGETTLATGDHPNIYGQAVSNLWMGPQMQR